MFGYDVPDGYTVERIDAADLKSGMLALISINNQAGFDLVESATPFVRPAQGVVNGSAKCMDVFYRGSNWATTYTLTDRIPVAVPLAK